MYPDIVLQFNWFGILSDVNGFLVMFIFVVSALIGFAARKLTIGGFAAFLIFVHISMQTDLFIFDNMLYAIVTIVGLYLSVQAYQFVYSDSDGDLT